jgi:hypothetical protein
MIGWILVGIAFVVLIFGLVKSARNWTWVPITASVLIFITAVLGGLGLSQSFKARRAWMDRAIENEKVVQQRQREYNQVRFGEEGAIQYSPNSLEGVNHRLNLLTIGEGRIWYNCQPEVSGNTVTIKFSATALDGATPLSAQLKPDMTLYLFADRARDVGEKTIMAPVEFVGSYVVKSVDAAANLATLEPMFVTNFSKNESTTPTTSWTLFERMPSDSRDAFRDSLGLAEFSLAAYRQALQDKYLKAEDLGMDPASREYEALLDEYTFDGVATNDIQGFIKEQQGRINETFDTSRSVNLLTQVQFDEPRKFEVDGKGNIVTDGPFDRDGLANDRQLHIGREATIAKDGTAIISRDAAINGYTRVDGTRQDPLTGVKEIVDYYTRTLRDYPHMLKETGKMREMLEKSIASVTNYNDNSLKILEYANEQKAHRATLIDKLQKDLNRRLEEEQIAKDFLAVQDRQIAEKKQQIRQMYEQTIELYQQLQQKSGDKTTDRRSLPGDTTLGIR